MRTVLQGWFKGPGNNHYEAGRFLWFISVVAGIGYAGAHLVINKQFSIIEFGAGMGGLLALGGGGIALKDRAGQPPAPAATATVAGDLNVGTGA